MRVRLFTENQAFYFDVQNDAGQLLLNSQAYTSESQRDADAEWVMAHVTDEDYYLVDTNEQGSVSLRIQNADQQTIATSPAFDNRAQLNDAFGYINSASTVAGTPYQGRGEDDDYEPLSFYQTHGTDLAEGFDRFEHEKGSFFTYRFNNIILLISEAYSSNRGRDNGIESVQRNWTIEERYERKRHPSGSHYFNLLAGNRQEIATSTWFRSAEEMENAIRILLAGGQGGTITTEIVAANRSAAIAIAAAPQAAGDTPPKKRKKRKKRTSPKPKAEKVYLANGSYMFNELTYQIFRSGNGKHYFTFKNADGKTVLLNANVRGFETQAEAQAAVDKILAVGPYERNFEGKTTKNGKYYFYLKDEEGKNLGKSFFFDTPESMQSSVGLFLGSEIATATFKEGTAAATGIQAETQETESTTARSLAADSTEKSSNKIIDQYLACASYHGHERSEKYQDFSLFMYEGEYYFAMIDKDDEVMLRSEGYKNEKGRENGIQSVIKNREIEKRWKVEEEGDHYVAILKAGNHQEIARSCPKRERDGVAGYWKGLGLLGAGLMASRGLSAETEAPAAVVDPTPEPAATTVETPATTPVPPPPVEEKEATPPPPKKKVVVTATPPPKKVVATAAAATAATAVGAAAAKSTSKGTRKKAPVAAASTASSGSSGFDWRWLLLLLPLLLLLWWKGCDRQAVAPVEPVAPMTEVTPAPTTPDEVSPTAETASTELAGTATAAADTQEKEETATTPAPAPAPSPVAATACTCDTNRAIFSYSGSPKSVNKLGSLPEFGNSHALSPSQFYEKLATRYQEDTADKAYLDYIYRSMGYRNFGDAKASQFSNVVIPAGTSGNLGFGTYHGYGYYTLNTNEHDRQAFKLQAANGCTIHFMKTCGNYFFYCDK